MSSAAAAVFAKVREFIDAHEITCAEMIYDTDRVIEDAYEFIEELCELVGYAPDA